MIEWGIENGKTQTNNYTISNGKQKRTPEEQALFEGQSLMNKKIRNGYTLQNETPSQNSPLPMLAKEYQANKNINNTVPIAIQPKLDGIRCLANVKTGELWSRKQTRIMGLDHISESLKAISFPGDVVWLDGELYNHDISFNEINSRVRRTSNFTNQSMDIQYWVYDVVSNKPFETRMNVLKEFLTQTKQVILTPTIMASANDVSSIHKRMVGDNYEGTMIRVVNSSYEVGKRSSNLLKYKDFCQEEFKVIGFKQKKIVNGAVTLGSITLQCFKDPKVVFNATPTMTNEEKQNIWENQKDFVGKIATVKFFEKTPKNIPRFPRLIGFRHNDDC